MQVASELAAFHGWADGLRGAMGEETAEIMSQRDKFVSAIKHGLNQKTASHIFDLMEHFAQYSFNKATVHYALISYQTAYLKATIGGIHDCFSVQCN